MSIRPRPFDKTDVAEAKAGSRTASQPLKSKYGYEQEFPGPGP
jgi:hypothetical protein